MVGDWHWHRAYSLSFLKFCLLQVIFFLVRACFLVCFSFQVKYWTILMGATGMAIGGSVKDIATRGRTNLFIPNFGQFGLGRPESCVVGACLLAWRLRHSGAAWGEVA